MMTVTVLNIMPVLLTYAMTLSKATLVLRCHKKDKVRGSSPFEWEPNSRVSKRSSQVSLIMKTVVGVLMLHTHFQLNYVIKLW